VEEAIAAYKKAIDLDPNFARPHDGLGALLGDVQRDYDGAIACFRKAIEIDPKDAHYHFDLGNALSRKGQVDEAIACYQKVIELQPNFAEAHCNLGGALRHQGRFAESLAAYQRGHELGTKQPGWGYPSALWVRQAQDMAALESKLPAFLKGKFEPRDTAQRLALTGVCEAKKRWAAAARLYADAFAADPKQADGVHPGNRYDAARAAALAGCGKGKDAPAAAEERARLRRRALRWLQEHLAFTAGHLASGAPRAREGVQEWLRIWQTDPDLAGIRDSAALARLAAEERAAWRKLWADVAALLKKAEGTSPKEPSRWGGTGGLGRGAARPRQRGHRLPLPRPHALGQVAQVRSPS
jgi:tetratricopeptide (TPR) repeat protein